MLVRFWGVRSSASAPPRDATTRFGSHTACVEVRDKATGALLVLDAGTGIEPLARAIGSEPVAVFILLSHVDPGDTASLAAFPLLLDARWDVRILAPAAAGLSPDRIRSALRAQTSGSPEAAWKGTAISLLQPGRTEVGGFHIRCVETNHPGGGCAYRIRGESGDLVYARSHRFGDLGADETFASFAFNSGATIFGASLTGDGSGGNGTATQAAWRQSTEFASATGAGRLWLFAYGGDSTDEALEDVESRARRIYPATRVAREGDYFRL